MSLALEAFESLILAKLHYTLEQSKDTFLHYDVSVGKLVMYCWPLNKQGDVVDPSALEEYRSMHVFSYPGCLCAAIVNSNCQTESVLVTKEGPSGREYFVVCAQKKCGYAVEALYRQGHPVLHFPHRVEALPLISDSLRILADVAIQQKKAPPTQAIKKTVAIDALQFIPLTHPNGVFNIPTPGSLIYRLHSAHHPGITFEEFRSTFVYCECGVVSTRRKHHLHECSRPEYSVSVVDVSRYDDSDILNMLLRLDMIGYNMTLETLQQIIAKCPCGMVMTIKRFPLHECRH